MKIERFEDIISWQKAKELNIYVYLIMKNCKDYSFKDQLQRASVSTMNNIAEGFERKSNNELRQFLYIAKGSAAECRSMLDLGKEIGIVNKEDFEKIYELTEEISKLLSGFIKTL